MVRVLVPRQFRVLLLSCPLLSLFRQNFALWGKSSNRGSGNYSEMCLEDTTCSEEISCTGQGTDVPEWQGKTLTVYTELAVLSKYVTIRRNLSLQCDLWQQQSWVAVISVYWHIVFTLRQLTLEGKKVCF